MEKKEDRTGTKDVRKKRMAPKEIHQDLVNTLDEESTCYSNVMMWVAGFQVGLGEHPGGPTLGTPKIGDHGWMTDTRDCPTFGGNHGCQCWLSSHCFDRHLEDEQTVCVMGAPNVDTRPEIEQTGNSEDASGLFSG